MASRSKDDFSLDSPFIEQIVGRERNQRACDRQLVRNVAVARRVNSTVGSPTIEVQYAKTLTHRDDRRRRHSNVWSGVPVGNLQASDSERVNRYHYKGGPSRRFDV